MEKLNTTNWGYLRESKKAADKAGIDSKTGLHRTGLEEYLAVIFPEIPADEWVHDKCVPGLKRKIRPDYRCERLKLIVEFDGLPHYKNPNTIKKDEEKDKIYKDAGYKVVRIPYFIQLTNEVIEKLFGVTVKEQMFDPTVASLGVCGRNTPAYCCPAGIDRMARGYKEFPQQYGINLKALLEEDNEFLTGAALLQEAYNKLP